MRTLVLGGIRSGKSRWAEEAISASLNPGQPVCYLAAGAISDGDPAWQLRVEQHRARRPAPWTTVETEDIAGHLRGEPHEPTLIDDLGRWLTSVLDRSHGWESPQVPAAARSVITDTVGAVAAFRAELVVVSPEVGLSVVAATASGRRFADELGTLNQQIAAVCDRVVLVVAGQALTIKEHSG